MFVHRSSSWFFLFFFKQKTAYEMRISDWSSDVCSSDLAALLADRDAGAGRRGEARRPHAAGPGADDEEIVVVPRHVRSAIPGPWEIGRASCRARVCQYV